MHIEKNVAATTMGFLLGENDTIAIRKDAQEQGVMPNIHLVQQGTSDTYLKPHAPYILRPDEKARVLQTIKAVRTPSGHCGNFDKLVNTEKGKMQFMKSHDWHILIQEVLPAAIRGSLVEGPRVAVIRLGHCFKRFCDKVIDRGDIAELQNYVAETASLLEIHFPLGYWNTMPHFIVHIPRELYWCGPVHTRWMYGVERYLGHLKTLIHNKARPEGSIAMGYVYEEALGFVTEHFRLYPGAARVIQDMDEDLKDASEVLEGRPRESQWGDAALLEVHDFIIWHNVITEHLYE